MKSLLLVLAGVMGLTSCNAVHAHVRAFVKGHEDVEEAKPERAPGKNQKAQADSSAKIAGTWQLTMETPHGVVKGPMELKQDGTKLAATWESEHAGALKIAGTLDGKAVSFTMDAPGGGGAFGFKGTFDGKKMSGSTDLGGAWNASR